MKGMKELFWRCVVDLYNDIPMGLYEGLLSIFCLGGVGLLALQGLKRGWRKVSGLLLIEFVFLIYSSTVIYRDFSSEQKHDFMPLWSYWALQKEGNEYLIADNILNVLVFLPVGLLLGLAFRRIKFWVVLLVGLCISSSIEMLQYVFKRGFAEVDDVIHNVLGCMIGYGIYALVRLGYEKVSKRIVAVL